MKNFIIIFALGAFASLSMAPANFWLAIFVGLSGLYILLSKAKAPFSGALLGFVFSLGYFVFSLSWIGNALLVEDNPYRWAWPLAVSALPALLSLFTAVGCYGYKVLCKNSNNFGSYIAFTTFMLLSEYARGHLFTGFPWNLYGYTWIDVSPIAQTASLSSIYLLTAMTIFWASAPAFIYISEYSKRNKAIFALLIVSSFACSYGYGLHRIDENPALYDDRYEVVIIQPNIKQSEKWKIENRSNNFTKQIQLSKYNAQRNGTAREAYYIIWPETAISQDILNTPWATNLIGEMLRGYPTEAYLITGALRYESKTKSYFNSIITFDSNSEIKNTYNKSHLVPFGEYMPLENVLNIAPIVGFTGFKKGLGQTTIQVNSINFSPLICYEIIFSGKALDHTSVNPDIIINVTNDAWYGNSAGPYQHLVQARFRAIETGIPVLRAANTGISAIIEPLGSDTQKKALLTEGSIIQSLPITVTKSKLSNHREYILIIFLIILSITVNCSKLFKSYSKQTRYS